MNINKVTIAENISSLKTNNNSWIFSWSFFFLSLILLVSFSLRIINLNYNVTSNDEAVYIVVGQLGLFQFDWITYNASAWIPGLQQAYTSLTALASVFNGIVGSRLLNVVFCILTIEAVFALTFLSADHQKTNPTLAGLISASLIGALPVSFYVSRLATMDMPCFYLFSLSLVFLFWAQKKSQNGKLYFIASLLFFLSIALKIITVIYLPIILLFSYLQAKKISSKSLFFWKYYFFIPSIIFSGLFFLTNLSAMSTYSQKQIIRERIDYLKILATFWQNSYLGFVPWILGSFGLLISKQWKRWLFLNLLIFWVLLFHLALRRQATLDKHAFLAVFFLVILAGQGLSSFWVMIKSRIGKIGYGSIFLVSLTLFWIISYRQANIYNHYWDNIQPLLLFLSKNAKNGDKALVEAGASPILAIYNKNYPLNITTYDWFEYHRLQGIEAYGQAVKDGYFNLIQVSVGESPTNQIGQIQIIVKKNLSDIYNLVFDKEGYLVYQRNY